MANAIKWEGAWVDRSNVLTTEMNGLTDGTYVLQSVASAIANQTNLDQYGMFELNLASLDPDAGGYVEVYGVRSMDGGSTYEDTPGTNNPATHLLLAVIPLDATSSVKKAFSKPFWFDPNATKFCVRNMAGVDFGATGNTLKLWTNNDEVQD